MTAAIFTGEPSSNWWSVDFHTASKDAIHLKIEIKSNSFSFTVLENQFFDIVQLPLIMVYKIGRINSSSTNTLKGLLLRRLEHQPIMNGSMMNKKTSTLCEFWSHNL